MTAKIYPIRCRIRAEGGETRVDVMDDIGPGFWDDGLTAKGFAAQLADITGPLSVHISSLGGDVFDGLAIAETVRSYNGPVTTVVDGIAASIASVIFQAGRQRVMTNGSMLMIHDASSFAAGNEADMQKMAQTLGKVSDNLAQQYADRAGGTPEQWRDAMKAETWYTAGEAVEAGLADRVGTGSAALPQGVDLDDVAAFAPGRIMAMLRSMPRAAAGDDGDGAMTGKKCKTCKGTGRLKHPGTGKPGVKCPSCDGKGVYDPDSDGDDDSTAEGDTDHDYVEPDGSPGPKAKPGALTQERIRALIREELRPALAQEVRAAALEALRGAAKVDESEWDASKAWAAGSASDDPEAFFRGICAGEKTTGEPDTQAHWALPYRYSPDSAPNAAAVRNCLARLDQTQDLKDPDGAKKKLEALMKQVNPDYEPEDRTTAGISGRFDPERYKAALKGAQ